MSGQPSVRPSAIWGIIPVKPFSEAKTRLAPVLQPQQRAALAEAMFRQALTRMLAIPALSHILVVSRDSSALDWARLNGALAIHEGLVPELNAALSNGSQYARSHGADALLVLPIDLPFVTPADIETMLTLADSAPTVVIAPDRAEVGTNGLLIAPPNAVPFMFGPASFERHRHAAEAAGIPFQVYRSPHVSLDLDTPSDWERCERDYSGLIQDWLKL